MRAEIKIPCVSFNPRARAGRDPRTTMEEQSIKGFNPRARAGRDKEIDRVILSLQRFNPRARAGRDTGEISSFTLSSEFQSTRPRGARPKCPAGHGTFAMFQSTRPRGARPKPPGRTPPGSAVSIHAPARGATAAWLSKNKEDARFNPRARAGRDPTREHSSVPQARFNPRARAGRD